MGLKRNNPAILTIQTKSNRAGFPGMRCANGWFSFSAIVGQGGEPHQHSWFCPCSGIQTHASGYMESMNSEEFLHLTSVRSNALLQTDVLASWGLTRIFLKACLHSFWSSSFSVSWITRSSCPNFPLTSSYIFQFVKRFPLPTDVTYSRWTLPTTLKTYL